MQKISTDNLEQMRRQLAALEPTTPRELTAREAVRELLPELKAALDRGVTAAELIGSVRALGLDIAPSTLQSYLRQFLNDKKTQKPKKKTIGGRHVIQSTSRNPDPTHEAADLIADGASGASTDSEATPDAIMHRSVSE
ncbi:hypothetical protein [Acidimangrovimonas sediminis]|uniref:hypothetical protein n=1 Tax=Acidimangrovimonas sediminis TaxID=2056283 RepID=UPI000C7FCE5F|nr:hypothetical protein [Acidimangrovimonas sediminis]